MFNQEKCGLLLPLFSSSRGIVGFLVGIVYFLDNTSAHVCYNLLEIGIFRPGCVWPLLLQGFLCPCTNIGRLFLLSDNLLVSDLLRSYVCNPGRGDTSCGRLLLDLSHFPAL